VEGRKTTAEVVRAVSDQVFMPLTVGGGIKSVEDIYRLLLSGADKVSINTAAVTHPELLTDGAKRFGNQCIVVAIDARQVSLNRWEVVTQGGRKSTGIDVIQWAKEAANRGAGEILLTSMDADGTLNGYDIDLTRQVAELVNVPLIASGGAGSPDDFADVLTTGKADAALAASLFHDNILNIPDLKKYLDQQGIPVRIVKR